MRRASQRPVENKSAAIDTVSVAIHSVRDQVAHMAFEAETRMRSSARGYP
jgi:hypothetical protein